MLAGFQMPSEPEISRHRGKPKVASVIAHRSVVAAQRTPELSALYALAAERS